ncbi:MAG: hypothetical protein QNJ64_03015 [Crocosphaera sp.]|nr:hypothetical protein [Crocosphaera sp.]
MGKEKRFQKHINHKKSRQLVNNAVTNKQSIAIEDLNGIRERTNKNPRSRRDKRLGKNIQALGAIINRPGGSGLSCKLKTEVQYIQLNLFDSLGLLKTSTSA